MEWNTDMFPSSLAHGLRFSIWLQNFVKLDWPMLRETCSLFHLRLRCTPYIVPHTSGKSQEAEIPTFEDDAAELARCLHQWEEPSHWTFSANEGQPFITPLQNHPYSLPLYSYMIWGLWGSPYIYKYMECFQLLFNNDSFFNCWFETP